ncbi:hypothetical protein ACSVDE_17845 [Pseudalkalibacillus sp. Hm43]|uniref:hypothetical protein n=1 Tax=Pseudalkalibacillus sp. Hm43 TaxID=3450742 RepID=UPI003F4327CA
MGQSKWNEEKIIQTLREFPKVEDSRSKEELFDQIQNKMGQEESEKKAKPFRFMPVLAAACILAIAAIISPTIMDQFDLPKGEISQEENGSALSTSTKSPDEKEAPVSEQVEPAEPTEEAADTSEVVPYAQVEEEFKYHAGITEVPEDKQVVTTYYPDQEAMGVVPVSFLAEKELSRVEALQQALSSISSQELGLSESGLASVNLLEYPNNTFVVDIKSGAIQGSTGERIFVNTVKGTAHSLGYDYITFKTEGENGYDFSHLGSIETIEVSAPEKGVSAILTDTGTLLLVNGIQLNGDVQLRTFEDALHWMSKDMEGFGYQETILENVFFKEITEDGKKVTIEFSEGTTLEDNMKFVAMLESILMAANQFGYEQVDFINAPIEQIGPYQLSGTLPVLKAPNVIRP